MSRGKASKESENCPACGNPSKEFIAGVCVKCRTRFEAEHRGKLDVEWKPSDFEIKKFRRALNESGPMRMILMDEEDAAKQEKESELLQLCEFFKRIFRVLFQYRGDVILAQHAFCLALGWNDILEYEDAKTKETVRVETDVDVAKKLYRNPKRKAAVTKVKLMFRDAMALPASNGQRSDSGRNGMTKARMEQLK
jgi:hypothetical protein